MGQFEGKITGMGGRKLLFEFQKISVRMVEDSVRFYLNIEEFLSILLRIVETLKIFFFHFIKFIKFQNKKIPENVSNFT